MFELLNIIDSGIAPLIRKVVICGACNFPVPAHTNDDDVVYATSDGFKVECPRPWESINHSVWYDSYGKEFSDFAYVDNSLVLNPDLSGTPAQSGSDLIMHRIAEDYDLIGIGADEEEYVSVTDPRHELSKVDRWRDATHSVTKDSESWVSTSILGEPEGEYVLTKSSDGKRSKALVTDNVVDQSDRNAFIEGYDGFLSVHLLDEVITEKYHNKLLNVYRDKQNFLRVGSVRIMNGPAPHDENSNYVWGKCVKCNAFTTPVEISDSTSRTDMENFIWGLVSHGNNHAAAWFVNRKFQGEPTFYELAPTLPETKVLTDEEELSFLMEHSNYCKDKACSCTSMIRDLVEEAALSSNKHVTWSAA